MPIIHVNEFYGPTHQGEGKTQGMPCHFLRLAGCNLSCIWCDTPYTWNWLGTKFAHPDKYDKMKESHKVKSEDLLGEILRFGEHFKIKMLVVTGGEPLLQQARLPSVLMPLKKAGWRIECETNGTILPSKPMLECVDQFNISPKLSNSGEPEERRIKHPVLSWLVNNDKCTFKFVVSRVEDAEEIEALVARFEMKPEQVWLMPEARTKEEHAEREPIVSLIAGKRGWNYRSRLHIVTHGNKRRV